MTDLDRLNAAILANPADDVLRGVYADKIEERDRPGDAERANLIRVGGDYTFASTKNGLLFSEGEPIDAPMLSAWYGVFDQLGSDSWPDNVSVSVSRGFIREVRGPLAALVGDRGEEYETPDGEASWRIPPAVLPAIAQAHPLEWVRATDAIHEDGRFPGGHRIDREQFPQELWLNLISWAALSFKGIVPPHANAITGTREELEELLSHALIAWARKEQT